MCLMRQKKMTGTDPVTGEQTYGYYIDGASSDWVGRSMIGYYFSKDTKVIGICRQADGYEGELYFS